MTDEDDYKRVENTLDDFESRIKAQYGKSYNELTDKDKNQIILDIFFSKNGKPQTNYSNSASALRIGLDARENKEPIKITSFKHKNKQGLYGKKIFVIRDEKGRFKRFIRD